MIKQAIVRFEILSLNSVDVLSNPKNIAQNNSLQKAFFVQTRRAQQPLTFFCFVLYFLVFITKSATLSMIFMSYLNGSCFWFGLKSCDRCGSLRFVKTSLKVSKSFRFKFRGYFILYNERNNCAIESKLCTDRCCQSN